MLQLKTQECADRKKGNHRCQTLAAGENGHCLLQLQTCIEAIWLRAVGTSDRVELAGDIARLCRHKQQKLTLLALRIAEGKVQGSLRLLRYSESRSG